MAKRRHENSISLFPFLAVLVCAMGALILLLLVTTRQIRESRAKEAAAAALIAETQPAQKIIVPPMPQPPAEIGELNRAIAETENQVTELTERIEIQRLHLKRKQDEAQQLAAAVQSAEQKLATLSADEGDSKLAARLESLRTRESEEEQLEQDLADKRSALELKYAALRRTQADVKLEERTLTLAKSALLQLRTDLETAKTARDQYVPGTTVVDFTNPTGTSRHPLLLDVTEDGFHLLSSNVRISPRDMEGMSVGDNPLLTAILSAHRFRTGGSVVEDPYVLLLVRPSGAVPFYMAQRILTDARVHFGYELVEQERKIAAGPVDDRETRHVRDAVLDSLSRSDRLVAAAESWASRARGPSGANTRGIVLRPDGRVVIRPPDESGESGSAGRGTFEESRENAVNRFRRYNEDIADLPDRRRLSDTVPPPQTHEPAQWPGQRSQEPTDLDAGNSAGSRAETNGPAMTSEMSGDDALPRLEMPNVLKPDGEPRTQDRPWTQEAPAERRIIRPAPLSRELDWPDADGARSRSAPPSVTNHDRRAAVAPFAHGQINDVAQAQTPSSRSQADAVESTSPTPSQSTFAGSSDNQPSWMQSAGSFGEMPPAMPESVPEWLANVDPALLKYLSKLKTQSGNHLSRPTGLTVFVDPEHMTVGQRDAVFVTRAGEAVAVQELFFGIGEAVRDAQRHPLDPVLPIVKFVVSPGGERLRTRLAESLKAAGVPFASVVAIEPYIKPVSGVATFSSAAPTPDDPPSAGIPGRESDVSVKSAAMGRAMQ